jgi:hypothetical protein
MIPTNFSPPGFSILQKKLLFNQLQTSMDYKFPSYMRQMSKEDKLKSYFLYHGGNIEFFNESYSIYVLKNLSSLQYSFENKKCQELISKSRGFLSSYMNFMLNEKKEKIERKIDSLLFNQFDMNLELKVNSSSFLNQSEIQFLLFICCFFEQSNFEIVLIHLSNYPGKDLPVYLKINEKQ